MMTKPAPAISDINRTVTVAAHLLNDTIYRLQNIRVFCNFALQ